MKKIITLSVVIFISLVSTFTSCKKDTPNVPTFQVSYAGSSYSFTKGMYMHVYPSQSYSLLYGTDNTTGNLLTIQINGTTSGTYNLGPNDASYMQLSINQFNTFTTATAGGSGTVTITQMDTSTLWAKGSFNGTVVGNGTSQNLSGNFTANFTLNQ